MEDITATVAKDANTLNVPPVKDVAPVPTIGEVAPVTPDFKLPRSKPTVIVFFRYCGDPFSEKNFRQLAALSVQQPGLDYIAVSLCSREVTDRWIEKIGGAWNTDVIIDTERNLYARWGLGLNTTWQLFNPRALYTTVALGLEEGIWGRAVDDGDRWQMGGAFAVDAAGFVRWVHVPDVSDDVVDFNPMLDLFGLPRVKGRRPKKPAEAQWVGAAHGEQPQWTGALNAPHEPRVAATVKAHGERRADMEDARPEPRLPPTVKAHGEQRPDPVETDEK
ncbi:hypothetical protein CMQ_3950 [Grosmannia clavigera kw1407]|uniref:Uncharacterized protein n=1 Tax=Grosmannia clavigera (strain kw1407 / UAMH 11150) TaxID=655863 RepID=F0XAM1_GROCL|nr:uncharacterized protein CMQ_3950 [Grosmannia clavigera kw1407]EFX05881.1 hypothetical protein CMQ_3950 [Grosmannia clavigera kw1407]